MSFLGLSGPNNGLLFEAAVPEGVYRHPITYDAAYVNPWWAAVQGRVQAFHCGIEELDLACFQTEIDPRILAFELDLARGDIPEDESLAISCDGRLSQQVGAYGTGPTGLEIAHPAEGVASHLAETLPVTPEGCTDGIGSNPALVQLRSCLHMHRHPLPFRATFDARADASEGRRHRQLSMLVRDSLQHYEGSLALQSVLAGFKAGSCRALASPLPPKPQCHALWDVRVPPSTPLGPYPCVPAGSEQGSIVSGIDEDFCRGKQCPGTDSGGTRTSGLADLRRMLAAHVELLPTELDRPEVRALQVSQFWWFSGYRIAGGVGATPQQDRFALFTTTAHVQVHSMRRGITLDSLVAEVQTLVPGLRSLRVMMERLPGFPAVQVIATTRDVPAHGHAVPLDLRSVGGRVCALDLFPGATANDVSREIMACPVHRRPTMPFRLWLPDGRNFVAMPYQVPGPDYIQGRVLPPDNIQPEPASGETDFDDAAHLQIQQQVQPVAPKVARPQMQDKISVCADTPMMEFTFAPDFCVCGEANMPRLMPSEPPEVQPPALLWHNFRAIETKAGKNSAAVLPDILPHYFSAAQRDQAAMDFSWGGVAGTANAAYATFDVLRHALVRPRRSDATLRDIVEMAIAEAPFVCPGRANTHL